ncbi:MAG: carboxypeptidase regulatory-like domain-containing protein [Geobacteraceae bacterium]|nr:carboxypeptidase regulatory-like domain-containing protein [Geobacteraceae bacterium]
MKQIYICLLLLLASGILSLHSAVLAAEKKGSVTGTVLSAETSQPVAGASIELRRLYPQKPPFRQRTKSDGAGHFRATLPTGSFSCTVSKEGFGTREETLEISPAQAVELPVPLTREARISGRIIDSTGTPRAGIRVSAGTRGSAVTDASGRFEIPALDQGWYDVNVDHSAWVAEKKLSATLAAGQKKDLGTITVRKGGSLTARLSAGGRPVARADISLGGNLAHRYARTDKQGKAVFRKLPPGSYTLESYDERLIESKTAVEIPEGKSTAIDLKATTRPPSLSLDEPGRVILTGKTIPLSVRGLFVGKASVTVHAVDTSRLLDGAIDPDKPETVPENALSRVKTVEIQLKERKWTHFRDAAMKLDPLPPGFYLVEASGDNAVARSTFLVTGLGLVAKAASDATLLFAANLADGRALEGVEISIVPASSGTAAAASPVGATDSSGLITLGNGSGGIRVIGRKGSDFALLSLGKGKEDPAAAGIKGYLYTERPAYRPGQTVFFKGILRKRVGEGYALPALDRVRVTVTDANDQTLLEKEYAVSSTGSFNGECLLPEQPALGNYTLKAESGGESWETSFKVLEYRKPEFEVTTSVPGRFYVGGDQAPLTLRARYYFGAPVADAKVKYRIYSRPYYPMDEAQPPDEAEDADYADSGYADFLGEGDAVTDANGAALIRIESRLPESARAYIIECDVTDVAGREVSATAGFTVTPSLINLSVRPLSYLSSPGRPVDIAVTSRTWEGKPVGTRLTVTLEEEVYDRKTHISSYRAIDQREVATDRTGQAVFGQTFPRPGYWRVTATAQDERGLKAVGQGWIWVWREGHAWDSSYRELGLELDKKSYRPGETARLIIKSPAPGASLLLTVEGRQILSRRVVPLNGAVEVIELPVTADHAPYVFVSAVLISQGRFYSRTKNLKVDVSPDKLDLKVTPDREVYAPGEKVRLSVAAAGNDEKPREAELSLAVVDEAMYAVSPDRRPDIYGFFRGSREHLVTTLNSFPRIFLGGAPKAAAAMADDKLKGIKVRKVFKDTAYWLPVFSSDKNGRAEAEFTLPDNLTTWRATVVGHDSRSEFGTGRGRFIARLDVMARLQPPRFLVAGDEVKIPGVITNMTESERNVTGAFEARGLSLSGDTRFAGTVTAGGTLRQDMETRADVPGEALLTMRAAAGDRGDAMELQLPVLTRGIERVSQGNIVLRSGEGETNLAFPENALAEGAALKLAVAPTLAASLNESLKELIDFPYGCVEQTMSRFLPAVRVKALLGSGHWSLEPDVYDKLGRVLDEGLRRLYDFQHEDGGWGWWKDDATDPYLTAHVMYGLALAGKVGLPVRAEAYEKGLKSLAEQLDKSAAESLPALYRAYTLSGRTNVMAEKKVEAGWRQLQPSQRIQYVEALLNANRKEKSSRLLDEVKKQVGREGSAAYLKDDDADSWWYSHRWSGSAVETTAMLLENQLAFNANDPLVPSLAEFLVRKRSGRWWNTTRGTAEAVTALARYVAATGELDASYKAVLSLNGRELERYVVDKGKITSGRHALTIPSQELKRGDNRVRLAREGNEGALYMSALLEHYLPPEVAAAAPGLSVERKLYRLAAHRDGENWRMEYHPLLPGESLAPGDEVEVRLTVENRQDLNFIVVEDRLPAGFEVRETRDDPRFSLCSDFWDWYAHKERHDEKMSFFIDLLSAGRHEFRYVIYPEIEGNVLALPASVWPMYVPSLRAESAAWKVKVKKD